MKWFVTSVSPYPPFKGQRCDAEVTDRWTREVRRCSRRAIGPAGHRNRRNYCTQHHPDPGLISREYQAALKAAQAALEAK